MDTITHAIVGATLARATTTRAPNKTRLSVKARVLTGGLAAAFPDIDFVTLWINPLHFISDWHRAETHSLIMLPIWALLLGVLLSFITKNKHHRKEFMLICGIGIFSHILTDLITSWGTRIFAPFSDYQTSWNLTFIIDPWFTLIILTALLVALFRNSRLAARAGIIILASYVGLQGLLKSQAQAIGEQFVETKGWQTTSVNTIPQPFSPFYWKIIVSRAESYHLAYVDLLASNSKPLPDKSETGLLHSVYYYRPKNQLSWSQYSRYGANSLVRPVWLQPALEPYRRFAAYPALYRIDKTTTDNCVWFMDLRFVMPQRITPFRYGMCKLKDERQWKLYRLKRGQEKEKERIPEFIFQTGNRFKRD
jgi:inner membrane protein